MEGDAHSKHPEYQNPSLLPGCWGQRKVVEWLSLEEVAGDHVDSHLHNTMDDVEDKHHVLQALVAPMLR